MLAPQIKHPADRVLDGMIESLALHREAFTVDIEPRATFSSPQYAQKSRDCFVSFMLYL
jgi:hypothetical protein